MRSTACSARPCPPRVAERGSRMGAPRWLPLLLLAGAYAAGSLGSLARAEAPTPELLGKRIYREGRLASGEPLSALLAGGVRVEGRQVACATCHRNSGLGAAEGQNVIQPLTVPGFFAGQKNERRYPRRAMTQLRELHYTDQTFERALREGRSADGRQLNPLMPRYALGSADIAALRAYLSNVAMQEAPGVTDSEIHFATIVAPDAQARVRDPMLQVLGAMVDARNAGTRSERHRLQAGVDRMHVNWRKWTLHVWELSGAADTWGAQLEQRYREQPVFAVLSGAGRSWQPVHDFCERSEIPCLFPNVDAPGRAEPGGYNLYLSRGVLVEADVMAAHLAARGWAGPVWQLRRDDPRAQAGARAFQAAWERQSRGPVHEVVLRGAERLDSALARASAAEPGALVLWLEAGDLEQAVRTGLPAEMPVLASGTLLGDVPGVQAQPITEQLLIAWPFAIQRPEGQRFDRVREWLGTRGIASGTAGEWRVQSNTYFAFTMASDAVAHLGNNYSRDYLIERIEHNADKSLARGAFPHLGLGPGQRFASKGAYLARLSGGALSPQGGWIVP